MNRESLTPRALKTDDETLAALAMLNGFDEDLATNATAVNNLIRELTQIHPALERVIGAHLRIFSQPWDNRA